MLGTGEKTAGGGRTLLPVFTQERFGRLFIYLQVKRGASKPKKSLSVFTAELSMRNR